MHTELLFFVQLARLGTRHRVRPLEVCTPDPPSDPAFAGYLGVPMTTGPEHRVVLSPDDAHRAFLTANEAVLRHLEPELASQLAERQERQALGVQVRHTLALLLPRGEAGIAAVAQAIGLSKRTLQRRLHQEGRSYQGLLRAMRTDLAMHYLRDHRTAAEISYLLAFEDPNSFYRAFQSWTGQTPEAARRSLLAGA